MGVKLRSSRVALCAGVVALVFGAGAQPASAAGSAADLLTGPVVVAKAQGVITSGSSMQIVVECSAVSLALAAATQVSCDAAGVSASATLPGQSSAAANTGRAPLAPFQVCASGATLVLVSGVWLTSPRRCATSIAYSAAVATS